MDSNNPKTLAPIPSQCTPYSYYCRPSEVFPNIPDRPELQKRDSVILETFSYSKKFPDLDFLQGQ